MCKKVSKCVQRAPMYIPSIQIYNQDLQSFPLLSARPHGHSHAPLILFLPFLSQKACTQCFAASSLHPWMMLFQDLKAI